MSDNSRNEPSKRGLSRRSFLRSSATGALAGGLLRAPGRAAVRDEAGVVGPAGVDVALRVNGKTKHAKLEPRVTLLDALRDHLDVTGPKKVCDRGTCGACTVIEDGKLIYACSRLAIESEGREIVTVEGLGSPEKMHPVQAAFVEHDAQQCGFCTPGFVTAISVLLDRNPNPSETEVSRALGGNLCRCGTYGGMRKVVLGAGGSGPREA